MICCFFKQKTAYEMRISDWSSDVCSSDLGFLAPILRPELLLKPLIANMRLINDSKINLGHSPALQCLDRSHLNGFRPIGHSVVRLDYADVRQAKVVKGLNRLIYQ